MAKYKIYYKLCHANGALVDEAWSEPLLFEIGDGQLDPCLERCVLEAKPGELQTFLLSASEAFGDSFDEAFQVMQRDDFPDDLKIELDAAVEFKTPTGDSYVGCIDSIEVDDIRVNFNHPLAGTDVSFQVKVLEIS
ncbi:FKBP-type peptidyl-prolyl cis-trans isomerase SlpA [Bathymodiolus heckerae thiotrophic gill symbiont]|uniref:FKBP-type peptidyl-prolyl cis-trans isomerase n=1 Tax=Bathymodiolus heckerae thiotrophic gill symbiont TaxID=1052212 RepID=UPI0010BC8582|nr:FKBP-type peptidyl-prolyl cis-trans isomerase [Bathymodiolus heckerae thiotrophic gill symbiont]SHN92854.1 FKBP-type peptidyl-prolyl cis-trans isomerase SlpA [Bathymodiolus heckerae thiotrophic gill symbiont]